MIHLRSRQQRTATRACPTHGRTRPVSGEEFGEAVCADMRMVVASNETPTRRNPGIIARRMNSRRSMTPAPKQMMYASMTLASLNESVRAAHPRGHSVHVTVVRLFHPERRRYRLLRSDMGLHQPDDDRYRPQAGGDVKTWTTVLRRPQGSSWRYSNSRRRMAPDQDSPHEYAWTHHVASRR